MIGLKSISSVLMNMVGWTIYRAFIFFLYLGPQKKQLIGYLQVYILNQLNAP